MDRFDKELWVLTKIWGRCPIISSMSSAKKRAKLLRGDLKRSSGKSGVRVKT